MRKKHLITGRLILTFILFALIIGILLPTILTVAASFMKQEDINDAYGGVFSSMNHGGSHIAEGNTLILIPKNTTLSQYVIALLQTPEYLRRFWNSVYLTTPIVVGQLTIASTAAYSLYRCRNKWRNIVFFLYVILMLLPNQVTLLPNYLVAERLKLLGTYWAIILPNLFAPFAVFLITRFMRRIPTAQLEAATLDGAGEWCLFTRICLPQCRSILWAVAMLIFADYWNMVEQPIILLDDPARYPLSIYLSEISGSGSGVAFAAATLYLIPPIFLFFYGQRHFIAGFGVVSQIKKTHHRGIQLYRRWALPTISALIFTALLILNRHATTINQMFTPEVSVTLPDIRLNDDGDYFISLSESVIHEDTYGHYVFVLQEQLQDSAVIYRVVRTPINIKKAKEDLVTVITGIEIDDRVVETSTRPLSDGFYVMLVQ